METKSGVFPTQNTIVVVVIMEKICSDVSGQVVVQENCEHLELVKEESEPENESSRLNTVDPTYVCDTSSNFTSEDSYYTLGEEEMWKQAVMEESKAFEDNQAWEVVEDKKADSVVQTV